MTGFGYNVNGFGVGGGVPPIPNGGHLFEGNTNGTQISTTWTAPENVTAVSVVCIGGGHGGGGGGALAYKNAIEVVPGNSYTVVVGTADGNHLESGKSYFINTSTCQAGSGYSATTQNTRTGDGGGNGGVGNNGGGGGAGGAGGYAGAGGANGGRSFSHGLTYWPNAANQYMYSEAGGAGSGGGGGGGGSYQSVSIWLLEEGSYSWQWSTQPSWQGQTEGGGVGVYGQGSNGAAGAAGTASTAPTSGGAGSGGTDQKYGGGAWGGNQGNGGAVRIIWGEGRAFPSTNVTKDYGGVSESLD